MTPIVTFDFDSTYLIRFRDQMSIFIINTAYENRIHLQVFVTKW
jgi:hypothetical protein